MKGMMFKGLCMQRRERDLVPRLWIKIDHLNDCYQSFLLRAVFELYAKPTLRKIFSCYHGTLSTKCCMVKRPETLTLTSLAPFPSVLVTLRLCWAFRHGHLSKKCPSCWFSGRSCFNKLLVKVLTFVVH